MTNDSLLIINENISKFVNELDIPLDDKIELLISLIQFINIDNYNKNIKLLSLNKKER